MAADSIEAIAALLVQAEAAHGVYESTELGGVYDQDWPRWYAHHAVEHGIGALLGHDLTVDELAAFLASSYDDYRRIEPTPSEPWATYIAARIAAEL
jgi:hypothetical protein